MVRELTGKAATGLGNYGRRSFASLSVYNYRIYFVGQGISLTGAWLQAIAQSWLALKLTHSGTQLGILTAMQYLPILFFGAYGGVIVDRFDKRKILYITQTAFMLSAFILALLVGTGVIQLWMLYILAISLGLIQMVDNPTRQTFLIEMVGEEKLTNAISLNSVMFNFTRILGPLIAGVLIAKTGLTWCFTLNGISFIGVFACLIMMRRDELFTRPLKKQLLKGQLAAGLKYVWRTPILRHLLLMMLVIGTLTYEYQVTIPLFATKTFHENASGFAALMAAMGIGSMFGGLYTAGRKKESPLQVLYAAILFGLAMLGSAVAPSFTIALAAFVALGFCATTFTSLANSSLQLNSDPEMRGRVMSLWTIAFMGSTPIGGPVIGYICQQSNPRWGLAVGGLAALGAGLFGWFAVQSYWHKTPTAKTAASQN